MGIIVENQNLFSCYRNGAYRKLLNSVWARGHYEIQDVLVVGLAYFKLRQFAKSRKCVDFVIERSWEQNLWAKHARFIRGQLAIIDREWGKAISYLEDLLCMEYPYEFAVTNSLAYAYWKNENVSQAVFNLERILSSDTNNASALNSLGFILADTDTDLRKAHVLCGHANRLKVDYSPYLDSFGWVLYKLGQRAKAIYTLRKAMILNPENQEVCEHLQCAATVRYSRNVLANFTK